MHTDSALRSPRRGVAGDEERAHAEIPPLLAAALAYRPPPWVQEGALRAWSACTLVAGAAWAWLHAAFVPLVVASVRFRGNLWIAILAALCLMNVAMWMQIGSFQAHLAEMPSHDGHAGHAEHEALVAAPPPKAAPTLKVAPPPDKAPPKERAAPAAPIMQVAPAQRPPDSVAATSGPVRVNDYFDRVFFLNAADDEEKRLSMRAGLRDQAIDAERFPAFSPLDPEIVRPHAAYMRRPLTAYEKSRQSKKLLQKADNFAHLRSWEALIRTARERGYRRILVFGDDVRFHANFATEFDRKVRLLPRDWKLLYLGASQHSWKERSLTWIPALSNEFYHPLATDGSFAIGIDASVFHILLFEAAKTVHTFDSGALRAVLVPFHRQSFVFSPNLVVANISVRAPADFEKQRAASLRWDLSLYQPLPPKARPPKVCVVSVFKNAATVVEYSLQSLLQQSYGHIEVIAVDDHSTDSTFDAIKRLAAKDVRIVAVRSAAKGPYAARNVGLDHCAGDIYANHEAEHYAHPDWLAMQVAPIADGRAAFTLSHSRTAHISTAQLALPKEELLAQFNATRIHRDGRGGYEPCCADSLDMASLAMRMSTIRSLGAFDDTRHSGEAELVERYLSVHAGMFFSRGGPGVRAFLASGPPMAPHYERVDAALIFVPEARVRAPPSVEEVATYEAKYRQRLIEKANPLAKVYNPF